MAQGLTWLHAVPTGVQPGETLRQLVERAGGLTPNAYLFGAELTRESTRIVQQQRLDDYVTQLELATDRAGAASAAGAITATDQTANAASAAATQLLVNRLRQLRASGRVVLSLPPDADSVSSLPDLSLEDGDRFIVPPRPSSVNVVGAVYEQSSFIFDPQRRVYGYLKQAGGANRDADNKHAFVIRADGSGAAQHRAIGADDKCVLVVGITICTAGLLEIAVYAPLRIENERALLIHSANHIHTGRPRRNDKPVPVLERQIR